MTEELNPNHIGLTTIQIKVGKINIDKKVIWLDYLGKSHSGYIHGFGKHFGGFAYEVSEKAIDFSKFDLSEGKWFSVSPEFMIKLGPYSKAIM